MKKNLILLSLFGALFTVNAQQILYETIMHDGMEREYILYIPANYSGSNDVPLIFNFHGYGSNATEQMYYGDFRTVSDTAGFIIVHPQGTLFNGATHWNVGGWTVGSTVDDVGFAEALIDSITASYAIDSLRIYATGMSNGGFMSFLLACQLNHKIAAIASVTGSMTPETYDYCNPVHPTPILQFHGTSDLVVPYDGATWTQSIDNVLQYWVSYNSCYTNPIITNLPDIDPNDGSTAIHYAYVDGVDEVVTEHYKIVGGGHTWPGSLSGGSGTNNDINASVEIWNFFSRFELMGGILDIADNNEEIFNVYPNPTVSFITIESNLSKPVEYRIMSVYSNILLRGMVYFNQVVDLSMLPPNIYLINIDKYTCKLIKTQ